MKTIRVKVLYAITVLLQIALVAGAFILNYFATTRMGMKRWLNYKNKSWQAFLPLDEIQLVILVTFAIATLILIVLYIHKKNFHLNLVTISVIVTVIAIIADVVFTHANNVGDLKSYYYMLPFFSLALLIQIVKSYIFLFSSTKDKNLSLVSVLRS